MIAILERNLGLRSIRAHEEIACAVESRVGCVTAAYVLFCVNAQMRAKRGEWCPDTSWFEGFMRAGGHGGCVNVRILNRRPDHVRIGEVGCALARTSVWVSGWVTGVRVWILARRWEIEGLSPRGDLRGGDRGDRVQSRVGILEKYRFPPLFACYWGRKPQLIGDGFSAKMREKRLIFRLKESRMAR